MQPEEPLSPSINMAATFSGPSNSMTLSIWLTHSREQEVISFPQFPRKQPQIFAIVGLFGNGIVCAAICEFHYSRWCWCFARTRQLHTTPTPACFFLQKTGGGRNRTQR